MQVDSNHLFLANRDLAGLLKTVCEKRLPFKFRARGMSMFPFICDGDTILIDPVFKKKIEIGEIVAYINPDTDYLIIHRIVKENINHYLLKGDNVYSCDGLYEKKCIYGYVKKVIINEKKYSFFYSIRGFFNYLNHFKKTLAFFSRYKILTFACRAIHKLLGPILKIT